MSSRLSEPRARRVRPMPSPALDTSTRTVYATARVLSTLPLQHREEPAVRRSTALLLILVPLAFSVCFTLLQQLFDYPAILRQPTPDVLARFAAGGPTLV